MKEIIQKKDLENMLHQTLEKEFDTIGSEASNKTLYEALATVIKDYLIKKRRKYSAEVASKGKKKVYYLCMEFLLGRSLKNNLFNLGIEEDARQILKEQFDANLDSLYDCEPDAGLGNGGLGRLAACFMDGLATTEYPATGYSICYEFGIFKQKIIDGWQTELPDDWLPGGKVWLTPRNDQSIDVHFGGEIQEFWDDGYHHINHVNYRTVEAIPYDMYISGYDSKAVSKLRLFKSTSPGLDMDLFNRGDYVSAMKNNAMAEAISKILYPNDNHMEGKLLRLQQQYFLVCAAINDITRGHIKTYGTMDNLAEKVAIHINDTHPAMGILELMRILLDDCGYSWEKAYNITTSCFAYTNHTVMREALEQWNEDLFRTTLPRLYQIVKEIDRRFCKEMSEVTNCDYDKIQRMQIVHNHNIRMANLSVISSHSVNGVSRIHSEIIKDDTFNDFYTVSPNKFTNVTNGIAARRWLNQSNPGLTKLCKELIGEGFTKDMSQLSKLKKYVDDKNVLEQLASIKLENKNRFVNYVSSKYNTILDPNSIFDVQVKRLHEYKRQHLNALHIITLYQQLLENPELDMDPHTFIFGAKAAPGYYLAKQIIRLISVLAKEFEQNPLIKDKLRIFYLEDYKVTLSELLMPASEVSEQISLAGTEASGTGNMKLMLNGAITLGTMDGANVEISEACGLDNIIIFGMTTEQVREEKAKGYRPNSIYESNPIINKAINLLYSGINGNTFDDIANSLRFQDPYMVLRDFDSYCNAQKTMIELYKDSKKWNNMSLNNIASSGVFSADRAIRDYAEKIWNL